MGMIYLILIGIVFLIANIWLIWYWALVVAICVVLGGFFVITDGMLD
jgi:hypothetical protein